MKLKKYKNDGWGLSEKSFNKIIELFETKFKDQEEITIVEFGSGKSTEFFVDFLTKLEKKFKIISFDSDTNYASTVKHNNLSLLIRNLEECSDKAFRSMFINRRYNPVNFSLKTTPATSRQKNTFYNVKDEDIPTNVDFVLLDGSHGNGRSISFLHLINKISDNAYVFIDDLSHYDFESRLEMIFNTTCLHKETKLFKNPEEIWIDGINCGIYKIKNKK